jgi:hypothetical protein
MKDSARRIKNCCYRDERSLASTSGGTYEHSLLPLAHVPRLPAPVILAVSCNDLQLTDDKPAISAIFDLQSMRSKTGISCN